jgi:catechol 2,3-dioxygenase-like lactoylglutathione lyase family enzyme
VLSHVSLGVRDLAASAAFYEGALAPLGLVMLYRSDRFAGFGAAGGGSDLDLFPVDAGVDFAAPPRFHLAFEAPSRAAVDGFWAGAMANGGVDNGPPGVRERYGPRYYAAFVVDPDGYRVEAVFQGEVG